MNFIINKLNGSLKIFAEFSPSVMTYRISLNLTVFPWFFKFSKVFSNFPGFPWVLWTLNKRGEGRDLPSTFLKIKKCSDFGKKALIQSVVLKVSWRKTLKCFPVKPSFLAFWTECSSTCPSCRKPSLLGKLLVARLHSGIILFAKRSFLNVLPCFEQVFVSITAS